MIKDSESNEKGRSAEYHATKAIRYFNLQNYEKSIECFSKALKLEKKAAYYDGRATCYLNLMYYDKARQDSEEAINLFSKCLSSHLRIINCCLFTGNVKKAEDVLQSVKDQFGRFPEKFKKTLFLRDKYVEFRDTLEKKRYGDAFNQIEFIISSYPFCSHFRLMKVVCLVYLDRNKEARRIMDEIIFATASNQDFHQVLYINGLIYYRKFDYDKAHSHLEVAQQFSSNTNEEDISCEQLLRKSKQLSELSTSGKAAMETKKYLKALHAFNEAISLEEGDHRLFFNRGIVNMRMGNNNNAKEDFQRSVNLNSMYGIESLLSRTECFRKIKAIRNIGMTNEHEKEEEVDKSTVDLIRAPKRAMPANPLVTRCKRRRIQEAPISEREMENFYEIKFVAKDFSHWTITRQFNGHKQDFPFSDNDETSVETSCNEAGDTVYKIKIQIP